MQRYRDVDGDSGVTGYEVGADFILLEFRHSHAYLYTYESAGAANIEEMKKLAALALLLVLSVSLPAAAAEDRMVNNVDHVSDARANRPRICTTIY